MDPSFHGNEKIPHSDDSAMMEPSSVLHEKQRQHHSHKNPYDQERPMKDTPLDDFANPSPSQEADKEFVNDQIFSKPEEQRMDFDNFTLEEITSFKAQAVSPRATQTPTPHDKKDRKATTTLTSTSKTSTNPSPSQEADKEFVNDQIFSKPEEQRMDFDDFTLEDITSFKVQAVSPQATQTSTPHDKKDRKATTTSTSTSKTSTKKTTTTQNPSKPTNNLPSLDDKDKPRQLPPNTRAPPPVATNTDNANAATTSFISLPPGSDLGKIGQLGQIGVFSGSSPSHFSPNQFLLMLCLGVFIMKMFLFNNNINSSR
ncbi:hypothetical protein BDC45DRAFT_557104 [Circinella umbellata]|nr:hypothetical protein BDC45DRAFT_557104 [Circinella umbellata]